MTWLPISTLRYYSQIELLPNLKRQQTGGLDERHLEVLRIIGRLKLSSLAIRDVWQFMELARQRGSTYPTRKRLIEERRRAIEEEMARLHKSLNLTVFKCRHCGTALPTAARTAYATCYRNNAKPVRYGSPISRSG